MNPAPPDTRMRFMSPNLEPSSDENAYGRPACRLALWMQGSRSCAHGSLCPSMGDGLGHIEAFESGTPKSVTLGPASGSAPVTPGPRSARTCRRMQTSCSVRQVRRMGSLRPRCRWRSRPHSVTAGEQGYNARLDVRCWTIGVPFWARKTRILKPTSSWRGTFFVSMRAFDTTGMRMGLDLGTDRRKLRPNQSPSRNARAMRTRGDLLASAGNFGDFRPSGGRASTFM
jgi:hypothetical protein